MLQADRNATSAVNQLYTAVGTARARYNEANTAFGEDYNPVNIALARNAYNEALELYEATVKVVKADFNGWEKPTLEKL